MNNRPIIIVVGHASRVAEIARAMKKDIDQAIVILGEAAESARMSMVDFTDMVHRVMPRKTCAEIQEEFDKLIKQVPITYEEVAFRNRDPKNYDKFLPKPLGKQRRGK